MKQLFIKLFLALFTLVMSANLAMAQVNMNRWIELTVQPGELISLDLKADADNTEVRVISGTYDTTFSLGVDWSGWGEYFAQGTTMTIYGNVKQFDCGSNDENLTEVNASNNPGLEALFCSYNNLSTIKVSGCDSLNYISCSRNSNLSLLDVSGLKVLRILSCYSNNLSTIKVSGCDSLFYIDCSGNNLSACGLDSLFHQLPRREADDKGEIIIRDGSYYDQPGAFSCRDTIATNRNWNVWDDETLIVNSNYECPYFTLGIEDLIINNINARVYPNPVSNNLNIECEGNINKLELYDAFGRIVISQVSVQNNTSIDVSSLANGIYILKLRTAEGVGEYKVVKN
jgi:hypothetical protein